MNIKITSKDGITLKTQGKYCTEDIKINVGDEVGGGGATITTPSGWQGTAVPNTGTVGKVYFNTNLSVEEVVGLLEGIEKQSIMGNTGCVVLTTNNHLLCALYNEGVWAIGDLSTGAFYFASADVGSGFTGWDSNFNGVIEINEEVGNIVGGEEVVFQNDKLSSLFSTTPFTQSEGEQVLLEGGYDGSTLVLDELPKGGWQGSVVPNSGTVGTLYFNTNLSIDEVKSIMDTLTYETNVDLGIGFCVLVYVNPTMDAIVKFTKYNGTQDPTQAHYAIDYWDANGFTYIFAWNNITGEENIGQEGWKGIKSLDINAETILSQAPSFGFSIQTDKFSSLISTTPFVESKPNTIDIEALIKENKLPLKIEVKGNMVKEFNVKVDGTVEDTVIMLNDTSLNQFLEVAEFIRNNNVKSCFVKIENQALGNYVLPVAYADGGSSVYRNFQIVLTPFRDFDLLEVNLDGAKLTYTASQYINYIVGSKLTFNVIV